MNKKYLYIHGLNSDLNSRPYQSMSKFLKVVDLGHDYTKEANCSYTQLSDQIEKNIEEARKNNQTIKLFGTSLGGFWALYFANKYDLACMTFNPVTFPHQQLLPFVGKQQNEYSLAEYDLTDDIVKSYQNFELNKEMKIKPIILLGDIDELIPHNIALEFWKKNAYCFIVEELHDVKDFAQYRSLMEMF